MRVVFSDRALRPGDPAYFDILHSFDGYRTCYYRTFAIGSASRAPVDAYKRCREILHVAIAAIRPGAMAGDMAQLWGPGVRVSERGGCLRVAVRPWVGLSIGQKPMFSRLVSLDHPEVIQKGMVLALATFWPSSDGW